MVETTVISKEEKEKLIKALENSEKIEREMNLSWDGSNLFVRIPKEIADYLELNKDNRFEKRIRFVIEETKDRVIKSFEIVDKENKHGKKK